MTAYEKLKKHLVMVADIGKAGAILNWDMETMMPPHASEERTQVMATLSALAHEKATLPEVGEWIAQAVAETDLDKRNLALIKQNYELARQVPEKLVYAIEEARGKTVTAWQGAKAASDWQAVLPELQNLFSLIREQGQIYADVLQCSVYDAMLFQSARGNAQKVIDPLFAQLKQELPPLVQQIVAAQKDGVFKKFAVDVGTQEKIVRALAEKIGYDFNRGRLDTAAHPFSGGTKNDSRITTRYYPDDITASVYGVLHEAGHALYTQGLPGEWQGQPLGNDSDMSLHESQSLITEKQAGLGSGFIHYLYHFIQQHVPDFAAQGTIDDFTRSLLQVCPSFIRVDADEATYPLHIVLRYEIEKKLFAGEMQVADIPEAWNGGFKDMLGLTVPEHRLGCMQDIHWYWGLFGYFPTYTQGALYAAQLFDAMKRDLPQIESELASGNFAPFNQWLEQKIHRFGQCYDAPELIERATGAKPDAKYFLDHLKKRYLPA